MLFSWSFGVLLYELLTFGREPYEDVKNKDEIVKLLKSGKRLSKPELADEMT